jgi:hypothetical protein
MGYQFDELAKDLARGVSRRRVLGLLLGGVASSVASLWLSGGKSEAAGIPGDGALGTSYLAPPENPVANVMPPSAPPVRQATSPGLNQTAPSAIPVPATQAGRVYVPGRTFFAWQPGNAIRSGYIALPWVRPPADRPRATAYEDASFAYSHVSSTEWTATRKSTTPLFNQGTLPLYGGIRRYYDASFRYDVGANGQWVATIMAAVPVAERPKIRPAGGSYCDATYCYFSGSGGDWIAISAATTSSGTPVMNQTKSASAASSSTSSLVESDGSTSNAVGAPSQGSLSNQPSNSD